MQNLQGTEIWIVAGVAFVLGFLIQWLISRSRKNALVHEYERQLQAAQRDLKRTQDDLETVKGQLDAQRERAEVFAAERANAQSDLKLAVEANSGAEEKLAELQSALEQEIERREAAEGLLEQTRTQAMDLQTSLDAARSDLTDKAARLNDEAEARVSAETALEAEGLRVSRLAQELETLGADLVAARAEIEAAVTLQQTPVDAPRMIEPVDENDVALDAVSEADSQQPLAQEEPIDQRSAANSEVDDTALAVAHRRVAELNDSVTALSAIGAELAVEFEKREQENQALRAMLSEQETGGGTGDLSLHDDAFNLEPEVAELRAQLSTAVAHNVELEHQLTSLQAGAEQLFSAPPGSQTPTSDLVIDAEEYQRLTAEIAQALARVGELEGQLDEETQSASEMHAKLVDAGSEMESLTTAMDELRQDRDKLADKVSTMQARLDERTEEVSALTSATVAAAATLKRREEAVRQSEALVESLRAQILEAEEEKAAVAAALEESDARAAKAMTELDATRVELASLALAKSVSEDKSTATSSPRSVQGHAMRSGPPTIDSAGSSAAGRADSQTGRPADIDTPSRAPEMDAVESVTTQVKEAAIRSAHSAGVTPGELDAPQDLMRLPGIGPRYQTMLYAAGIGTFWEFASCTDEDVLTALGLDDTVRMRARASEARTEARKLAQETGTVGMLWSNT